MSVLEIGTGSGFQAAALSALAHKVVTLDRWRDLAADARGRFGTARLMRTYAHVADGLEGWADDAPYDRIVVNAALEDFPQALLEQLKPGGVMVAPLGDAQSQRLVRYRNGEREDLGPIKLQPLERGVGEGDAGGLSLRGARFSRTLRDDDARCASACAVGGSLRLRRSLRRFRMAAAAQPAPPRPRRRAATPVAEASRQRARRARVQETPNWADGEGTPLSAYALQPEDAQPFDPAHLPRTHRVGANESLYDIATRYQVPLRALIDQNHLEPPYALAPGRELQLPPPRFHTVARGESFEDIARRYNVDSALARAAEPHAAAVSRAPGRSHRAAGDGARDRSASAARRQRQRQHTPLRSRIWRASRGRCAARSSRASARSRAARASMASRSPAAKARRSSRRPRAMSSMRARTSKAYGTLVLVRHADNYVTAYGHARRALVREGQHVRAGEAIAELGPRPDGRPRLLFQVRRGSEALDPAPLLGLISAASPAAKRRATARLRR